MAWHFGYLRDPYRPGEGPVVQPWIQPARRTLLAFRRYWPWFSLTTTSLLIMLATWSLQKEWRGSLVTLLATGSYVLVALLFDLADRHIQAPGWQQNLRALRKLGVLIGLTAVHFIFPAAGTELWLLYLIPMLTIGIDLERHWVICLIPFTAALLFFSAWPVTDSQALQSQWPLYMRNGAIRALMGSFAGATSYLLARCLAYQNNTIRAVLKPLQELTRGDRWLDAANAIAEIIADRLSEPGSVVTTNVLVYEPTQEQMQLIGSSTPAGQALARTGFTFAAQRGITGWAAQHQEPCFINDTNHDPDARFLAMTAFPGTRSALAVPLRLDHKSTVVLEIESPTPHDVAYEDLQLMNHIAHSLLMVHQRNEVLQFHQKLTQLGTELAERIIQVEEIGAILEEIGVVALTLLEADVIGFYYRNPETGRIEQRRTVGHLYNPETKGSPVNHPQSIVTQLMTMSSLQIFPDACHDQRLTRKLPWHLQQGWEPFVIREQIQACAVMPLIVGKEKLGLMWVNYRRRQEFTPELCSSIQLLAPYAALAIKSGVQSVLAERQRRDKLRRDLHDSLAARLRNAGFAMDRLETMTPHTPSWKETLLLARLSLHWAASVVDTLQGERATPTLQSLLDDLQSLTNLSGRIYGVAITFTASQIPDLPVSHTGGIELLFACEEALQNALRHAAATQISVTVAYQTPASLQVCICDNGVGFDIKQLTRVGGIENMRSRIEQSLGGAFTLRTAPGQGTQLVYHIPLVDAISHTSGGNL